MKEDYRKKFEKKFTEYRTEFEKTPESFQILVLTFGITSLVPKGLFNFGFTAWVFYNLLNKAPYVQDVHYREFFGDCRIKINEIIRTPPLFYDTNTAQKFLKKFSLHLG